MTFWTELLGTPFELTYVDAGGTRTRSLQAGEGDPVLFLHGTSGHLEAFVRNIRAHAQSYRCHAFDLVGHGYTAKPNYPYEIPRYVEHVLAYMDAVGTDRVHLVGESLGGWVAAWLASEHPRRVASLQLLAAGGTHANPAVMERIRSSTLRAVRSNDLEITRERLNLLMHDAATNVTDELVEIRHRIYREPSFKARIDNVLCLQDMPMRRRNLLDADRLTRITSPTLILWGLQNPFGKVAEAEWLHQSIRGSRLELFPECGHWPQYEHPERYNALSLAFLAESSGGSRDD